MTRASAPDASALQRAAASCGRLLDLLSAGLLAAVAALVVAQVSVRYLLGGSLVWSEELSRLLFVWMVLLAASRAAPMRIELLLDALPPRAAALLRAAAEMVVFALTAYLVYGAWGMADLTAGDRYIALGLSVSWLYLALFVCGILWLVRSLLDLVHQIGAARRADR